MRLAWSSSWWLAGACAVLCGVACSGGSSPDAPAAGDAGHDGATHAGSSGTDGSGSSGGSTGSSSGSTGSSSGGGSSASSSGSGAGSSSGGSSSGSGSSGSSSGGPDDAGSAEAGGAFDGGSADAAACPDPTSVTPDCASCIAQSCEAEWCACLSDTDHVDDAGTSGCLRYTWCVQQCVAVDAGSPTECSQVACATSVYTTNEQHEGQAYLGCAAQNCSASCLP